jgi:hypothetical protein
VPHLDQGDENSCGTTGLTMILDYLLGRTDVNQADIDRAIRRVESFGTSPTDLAKYARSQGLESGMYNRSTIDNLKDQIRQGHAVQVAINDPYDTPQDGLLDFKDHYLIVTGFVTKDGKEYVKVRDSNGDDNPNASRWSTGNADYLIPLDIFEEKWGPDTDDGYDNFMIVYAPAGTELPPDRLDGVEHSVAIAQTYWNEANNTNRLFHPDDFGSLLHGAIGTVGGG